MMVGMFVFGILMVVTAMAVRRSTTVWERSSGSSTAQLEMRKAHAALMVDLERTESEVTKTSPGPITLSGRDGDAIWFLSPMVAGESTPARTDDGRPFWQRNILYYLVIPNNHQALYGLTCTGGADAQGYESRCPHKVLVRKVIDAGPTTSNVPGTPPETLLNDVSAYLTRPNGFDVSTMYSEPGAKVEDVKIVAQGLTSFRATMGGSPQWPGEVLLEVRAARVEEARRTARIGVDPLDQWTQALTFSVFPPLGVEDHKP